MTVVKRVLLAVLLLFMTQVCVQSQDAGELPRQEGRALNFDFETGDLRDWRIEGEAFRDQPIEGDTAVLRRGDMRSQHQGRYWIGGFEKGGDRPRGKLISVPFAVTHPYASFLVGGGNHVDTCVELVDADRNEVIFRASGLEEENLQRVLICESTPVRRYSFRWWIIRRGTGGTSISMISVFMRKSLDFLHAKAVSCYPMRISMQGCHRKNQPR
ncbi:MAG TPA: hypothetical protein PKA06_09425 [Gemmatales bacterium]|nr:hypothetical protein [Gemmatales bacterium]